MYIEDSMTKLTDDAINSTSMRYDIQNVKKRAYLIFKRPPTYLCLLWCCGYLWAALVIRKPICPLFLKKYANVVCVQINILYRKS